MNTAQIEQTPGTSSGGEAARKQKNKEAKPSTRKVKKSRRNRRRRAEVLKILDRYKKMETMIRNRPFQRVVRETAQGIKNGVHFQPASMDLLKMKSEAYLVRLLKDAYLCTIHAKRVTIQLKDIQLVQKIHGRAAAADAFN